jgi:hypothetical protein
MLSMTLLSIGWNGIPSPERQISLAVFSVYDGYIYLPGYPLIHNILDNIITVFESLMIFIQFERRYTTSSYVAIIMAVFGICRISWVPIPRYNPGRPSSLYTRIRVWKNERYLVPSSLNLVRATSEKKKKIGNAHLFQGIPEILYISQLSKCDNFSSTLTVRVSNTGCYGFGGCSCHHTPKEVCPVCAFSRITLL